MQSQQFSTGTEIIYEYNGTDIWTEPEEMWNITKIEELLELLKISKIKERVKFLAKKHNCDISEINVRFTE